MKKLITILFFAFPFFLYGQQITVSGTVKLKGTGETLIGVTVAIKGTQKGTTTNLEGQFELKANQGDVLQFSFIGMETVDRPATTVPMVVEMNYQEELLEEVEVVSQGYFDVAKEDLTGSISQIDNKQMEKIRANSIENLIQGQVAGVVVSENADPGGGIGISIRGTNSILGGTQPLYVVDGIPINPTEDAQGNEGASQSQSSLSFLNPNDIEKIEILKDASATAIYGARGANGVVIITTKTAEKAEGSHSFSAVVDHMITEVNRPIEVLNGSQFESYMNQRALNQLYVNITDPSRTGMIYDGSQPLTVENFPELEGFTVPYPQTTGVNTNWQDQTYRMAQSTSYNLSYRGGTKDSNIAMSLGLLNNEGVILNSDFNRVTYNMNAMRQAGKWFTFKSKTNLSRSWGNGASTGNGEVFQQRGVVSLALRFQPIFAPLDEGQDDDIYAFLNEGNLLSNPYTLATSLIDQKKATNLLQSGTAIFQINSKLTGTLKGAFNYQRNTRDMYYPTNTTRGRRNNGEATQAYFDRSKIYTEANLRYETKFGKFHRLDAIAIGTYEETTDRRQFNKAFGFGSDVTSFYNFNAATDILVPQNVFNSFSLLSGLARVGYSYKRKYFIDVNMRMDASSKFAANKRSALFPSVSLGWNATKEKLFQNINAISYLKFRASYGQTGSNPIAPYQSLSLMNPIRYNFDNNLVTGFYESNLANNDLTWETTEQFNFGFDLNLYKAKVRIVFDVYAKYTRDLLQEVNLPASNGYATIIDNFGEISNKGFDLSIGTDFMKTEQFTWSVLANISRVRNELVRLNSNLDFQLGPDIGFARTNPIVFMAGQPLGIYWGAQTDGVYANWEEALASGIEGAAPGEIRYINHHVDRDADGNPLPNQVINFDDYVKIGDPNPDFTFAITNNLTYKNFDLSILVTGQKGGDIFWVDSWQLMGMNNATNVMQDAFNNSWKAPIAFNPSSGEVTYNPAAGQTEGAAHPAPLIDTGIRAIASDRQVFDGSFIRLKNINLGYTHQLKNGMSLRAYLSATNLITITDYPGYDPETQAYNKDPQRRGVDFGTYPGIRTYVVGLRFNL